MKCKRCGEELPERARFCLGCGAPVEEVPAPKKLEQPLEPIGLGAVPFVPAGPTPRSMRASQRAPKPYGSSRVGRSSTHIPLSAYPTLFSEKDAAPREEPAKQEQRAEAPSAKEPVEPVETEETLVPHEAEEQVAAVSKAVEEPAEKDVQPEVEPEPEVAPEPEAEAEKDVEPEPVVEAEVESEDAPELEPEPEVALEPEDAPELEPEPAPEPEQEIEPEPEPTPQPEPEPQPAPAPAPEPEDISPDKTSPLTFPREPEITGPAPEPAPAPEGPSILERLRDGAKQVAASVVEAFPESNDKRAAIGIGALVAVLAIAFLVYVSVGWFSPFADRSYVAPEVQPPSDGSIEPLQPQEEEEEPENELVIEGGPEARASLEEYSWTELSQISSLIAEAQTDDLAIQIAAHYGLCSEGGTIDAANTKTLSLANGVSVPIAVGGFRHDTRSGGAGQAGITFIARGSVGAEAMNALAQTAGGWEASTLRSWLNEGLLAQLPAELADLIVAVNKTTNPVVGSGEYAQSVTSDRVWVPSYSEIVGEVVQGNKRYGIYEPEGAQYRLFIDLGVTSADNAPQIALSEYWWQRSPAQTNSAWFMCVSPDGDTGYGHLPATPDAVVIGFCL